MKVQLELNIVDDGRVFLNHWDYQHGNDTCVQVIDGKLFKLNYDEDSLNKLTTREISLQDFITEVSKNA